jgi:signal transduction histidine kinase
MSDTAPSRWSQLSLAQQFALAGGLVMLLAAVIVGFWVTKRIEDVVVRNTANATALYMESFISPLAQDLSTASELSPASVAALERLLVETPLGQRVVSFKIWAKGARVIASSDPGIIGKSFEPTENLRLAWSGLVRADFNDLGDEENAAEQELNLPLLEIYSPIRQMTSGEVIAVAEFYEIATQLRADLIKARLTSWAAVALVMAAIWASLFAIVLRGSRTIDAQVVALTEMAAHNVSLRLRVQGAAARFSALNDQALRRIGADLHDGPAQLMGFAALRLDALRKAAGGAAALREIDQIESAVKDAIKEIRNISRGVSLPDIDRRPFLEVLQGLVDAHAARTGGEVAFSADLGADPARDLPLAVKLCVGRVVQEGLTNAWRHAGGQGQEVTITRAGDQLRVAVRDRGAGLAPEPGPEDVEAYGLGLAGLAGRVESLGGKLALRNRRDGMTGAELVMEIDLGGVE